MATPAPVGDFRVGTGVVVGTAVVSGTVVGGRVGAVVVIVVNTGTGLVVTTV
jgi:hypothetical protein